MTDTIVKSISTEQPAQPLPVEGGDNTVGNYEGLSSEPIEKGDGTLVKLLDAGIDLNSLPEAEKGNISEIEGYIHDLLAKKGVTPTEKSLSKELVNLKNDMGLDPDASPEMVMDRIGGVVKAWKGLSFVKDSGEKKQIFFKLANATSSKAMNEIVFKAMENHNVWL